MDKIYFYLGDNSNVIIKETCISVDNDIVAAKQEVVMDKKTFKECYKKWILEEEDTQEAEKRSI